MAIFLDWFASHNTLVIQSLAAIVALLIIFLIFRLFFVPNEEAEAAKNVTYAQLEEKLNKLLEQQSQMKVSVAAVTDTPVGEALGADAMAALSGDPAAVAAAASNAAGAGATGTDQAAELSRLRAEISTLKDSVKRKEVEILDAKEQAQKSVNTAEQDAKLNTLSGKLTDYEKEIEALKNRLSDYEIIAEDIADLQQYKKENQELKSQLANNSSAATIVEANMESGKTDSAPATDAAAAELLAQIENPVVEETPVKNAEVTPEPPQAASEPVAEPVVEETVEELTAEAPSEKIEEEQLPNDFFAAASAAMEEESIPDSEPETMPDPDTFAEKSLDNAEAREVSKGVTKEDKNLLDEFEKHFSKDED